MNETIFKAYDIRGIYPEAINEEASWKIGHATAQYLRSLLGGYDRGQSNAQSLIVGHDMRTHSPAVAKALIDGMTGAGANVIDIGMIDTPQIYFAINHLGTCGGVQVTASHNPAHYNGFKISGQQARPIGSDTGLPEIKHIAVALKHMHAAGNGQVTQQDLTEPYKKHVLNFLQSNLKKLKVVIDASNGMAGRWAPLIFGDLNLELITLNMETNGTFKHEPNPLVEANLSETKQNVIDKQADVGFCFDGDADRLMVVDETGNSVGCDLITALMAEYFLRKSPGSPIVYDLRSSRALPEEITRHGGKARRERVGHVFMKKTLKESKGVFGGELSGHFYYRDNFYTDSGMITLVHLLNILSNRDTPLSELIEPLDRYAHSGEINFEVADKQGMMKQLEELYPDAEIDWLDGVTVQYSDWWFNCRPSNTEPLLRLNIEAPTPDFLDEKLGELKSYLGEPADH